MSRIAVLGAGLVGKAIAIDLAKKFEVEVFDINEDRLKTLDQFDIRTHQADLVQLESFNELLTNFNLVVGALPGKFGYLTLEKCIIAGKDVVDISFFPEDPFTLDEIAQQMGVTVVIDCGVAPGMGNIILGYYDKHMEVKTFECQVGGLPKKKEWPYQYKAVFSPSDVIEEYVRPARMVKDGEIVVLEALSDVRKIDFGKYGTFESWNSDGLRTLLKTMKIPNMTERTIRHVGTTEYLKVLRETGFFSDNPVNLHGLKVKPIDITSALLFPMWELKPGEEEFTVMQIVMTGNWEGEKTRIEYFLYDEYDNQTNTTSMARTTGYTCTAVANLLLEGKFNRKGICPPEILATNKDNFQYVLNYLDQRGVHYTEKKALIN